MKDSESFSLRSQDKSLCEALYLHLGECEDELEAISKPDPDDYPSKLLYEFARREYNRQIRAVWDRIRELMDLWPSGV